MTEPEAAQAVIDVLLESVDEERADRLSAELNVWLCEHGHQSPEIFLALCHELGCFVGSCQPSVRPTMLSAAARLIALYAVGYAKRKGSAS